MLFPIAALGQLFFLTAHTDATARHGPAITLEPIATVRLGPWMSGAAEIVAHDPASDRLFVVNGHANAIETLSIGDPSRPRHLFSIDLAPYGGAVNSVATRGGLVAAAVAGFVPTDPGRVVLFDRDGGFVSLVQVGSMPDMVAFTPDGRRILTANEGEPSPDYTTDPEGSISVIDLPEDPRRLGQHHVRTAGFARFNDAPIHPDIRVFGPGASVAQDLEPEYIAVCPESATAYVTLQENNALAVVDIEHATVTGLIPLGYKDHSTPGNGIDASDRNPGIDIRPWPVFGMHQPDTIAGFTDDDGVFYLVTADEGDTRSYEGFDETARVRDLDLCPDAFPDADTLQRPENLGRLQVTTTRGPNTDGRYERLYAFGGRGFSIRTTDGALVFESGDAFERVTAERVPHRFNTDSAPDAPFKNRSDNRGPEPEALAVGRVGNRTYAFIGLERTGGVMIYDVTTPARSSFIGYWSDRAPDPDDPGRELGGIGPECLLFIPAASAPTGEPLLVSANEISGTLTVLRVAAPGHKE